MYNKYQIVIKHNLDLSPDKWYFKSDIDYNAILEHVTVEKGYEYLNVIKEEFKDIYQDYKNLLIELCYINDEYGKTVKHDYEEFCVCSPTCLRYIYHALLNLRYIQSKDLKTVNIIEIGGGYGGLCFFIHMLATIFDVNVTSYHIFDLQEAVELQRLYLSNLGIKKFTNSTLYDIYNLSNDSYLISNYCFSEIDRDIQKEYIEKIISKYTSCGMLVWNHIELYRFVKKELIIEKERPLTSYIGSGVENKFVYF